MCGSNTEPIFYLTNKPFIINIQDTDIATTRPKRPKGRFGEEEEKEKNIYTLETTLISEIYTNIVTNNLGEIILQDGTFNFQKETLYKAVQGLFIKYCLCSL